MEMGRILKQVEKPIRYTGGEINMCRRNLDKIKCRVAFCFPDVYEIGMLDTYEKYRKGEMYGI